MTNVSGFWLMIEAGSRLYGPDRGVYLSQFIAADFRQHNRRMGK